MEEELFSRPWRKSSGLSSPSRGTWRRGGDLGALLFNRRGGRAQGSPLLPEADGGAVGTSMPSCSAAIEDELGAILSLPMQMAAR
jgi:hypothetical protein